MAKGLFDESLFKNTLLDGEMVKKNDGKWTFIINDIICNEGVYLYKETLPERLKIVYNLLETKHTPNNIIDVCDFKVKVYFYPYQESINELIKISKMLDYTCRGIYLWSYDLKHKPKLFNFDENIIINVVRKVKDETEFHTLETDSKQLEIIVSSPPPQLKPTEDIKIESNEKILWITKTDEPDVYNLYDNENTLSSHKIGIALIQSMQISKMLRIGFKNKNAAANLKYKCVYNTKFEKWQPIEMI